MNIIWSFADKNPGYFLFWTETGLFFERLDERRSSLDTYTSITEAEQAFDDGDVVWV